MFSWLISLGAAILAVVVVFFSFIGFAELSDYLGKKRISNRKLDETLRTISTLTGPIIGLLLFLAVLTWVMHGCFYESN